MSVLELHHNVSDHPLDCLRKTTKSIDELCSDLNKLHESYKISVPELPHNVSDHPLDCLSKTTKSIDELCLDLNKLHERNQFMYNYMVKQLQNFKLHIQYQEVPDIFQ